MSVSDGTAARILVADDDEGVTSVVERALRREGYVVVTAPDGDLALQAMRDWRPDLLVLDVVMPGLDGLAVCRKARAERPDLGIVLLTAKDGAMDQVVGLDCGADDYLVKPFSLSILAARLRAVLRRREPVPEVLRVGDLELDTAARAARRGGRDIALTATEYKLLLHLMREAGRVLEVYVGYLRHKLEAEGEPRLIQTLRGSGYMLRATP